MPLALTGLTVFFVIAFAAAFTRPASTQAHTDAIPVFATADPNVTAKVIPDIARGRLARDDRERRAVIAVRGLLIPIDGATLPEDPELLPNAARDYRGGWHEGIDFPARAGTPVRAVAAGIVVRVDHEFVDWDRATLEAALDGAVRIGYTPAATLDRTRGRQVWIDHGRGVVTRYAHLSAVADIAVGDAVEAGQVIGAVGSSGYPEGGPHLHLEIRIGPDYLGDGLEGDALRAAISAAFD